MTNVDSGVRLADVSELEVVGVSVVRTDGYPVVLGDDVRVDRQSAFLGMQPRNLQIKSG